jgi:hypothetical protein
MDITPIPIRAGRKIAFARDRRRVWKLPIDDYYPSHAEICAPIMLGHVSESSWHLCLLGLFRHFGRLQQSGNQQADFGTGQSKCVWCFRWRGGVCAIAMPDDPQGDTIHFTLPHHLVRKSQARVEVPACKRFWNSPIKEDLIEDQC